MVNLFVWKKDGLVSVQCCVHRASLNTAVILTGNKTLPTFTQHLHDLQEEKKGIGMKLFCFDLYYLKQTLESFYVKSPVRASSAKDSCRKVTGTRLTLLYSKCRSRVQGSSRVSRIPCSGIGPWAITTLK